MTSRAKLLNVPGRPAREHHGTKAKRIWRHDKVVVATENEAEVYYVPRRCKRCHEIIVFDDLEEVPCCPACGDVFGESRIRSQLDLLRLAEFKRLKAAKRGRVIFGV